ncbi:MAG: ABC transporter substrate-binding protein, partial [Clostridia bacterium]|nr:ABC transporter substrate-binding protein [Clostridia bacterium]
MKQRFFALIAAMTVLLTCSGCKKSSENDHVETAVVRFLNFKPEIADVYKKIAETYKQETGRTVMIETAANNAYEQTLSAKMATSDAPTIFQINGPRGYANWERYCADLKGTELYKHLTDKNLALTASGGVYGIPYVVEGYGIIYNNAVMERYFALKNRKTDFSSMSDINNFEKLKALAEDLQDHAAELGIKGAFAATSLKPGEDWRWQTHLANIPLYYEFKNNNIDITSDATKTIRFQYADNFRNIFDLYLNNSTVDSKTLGTKIVDESMTEFALGQCAMVQNG